jgi:hypothetical protein
MGPCFEEEGAAVRDLFRFASEQLGTFVDKLRDEGGEG